jgi:hypothetical protein
LTDGFAPDIMNPIWSANIRGMDPKDEDAGEIGWTAVDSGADPYTTLFN